MPYGIVSVSSLSQEAVSISYAHSPTRSEAEKHIPTPWVRQGHDYIYQYLDGQGHRHVFRYRIVEIEE